MMIFTSLVITKQNKFHLFDNKIGEELKTSPAITEDTDTINKSGVCTHSRPQYLKMQHILLLDYLTD